MLIATSARKLFVLEFFFYLRNLIQLNSSCFVLMLGGEPSRRWCFPIMFPSSLAFMSYGCMFPCCINSFLHHAMMKMIVGYHI